ncbi:restriction endonuclease [Pseudarthrobacter sp. NKDBFgelt]|uniref:HNH endonuclease n=1 Tax=Pseudarthrobacter sp. NKDBFgelt TaxID=3384443 RepID=UPI0038D3DFC6
MAAVILGWNPSGSDPWDYHAAVGLVAESGRFLRRWSGGLPLIVPAGSEAWLFVQGGSDAGTGLIGHGVAMSEPYQTLPGDSPAEWHVSILFDALLPLGEQIRQDTLRAAVPGIPWSEAMYRPGVAVPGHAESGLRRLWRDLGPAATRPPHVVSGTCPPDAVSTIDVNRHERNLDARRVCLAFHGTSCAACGFSFEAFYGDAGSGSIDVHHVVPPELLGSGYQLDPVADLVPMCPNCHTLAHGSAGPPRTVSELRHIISASGHLRGEVVSDLALQAQEDARRILEGPGIYRQEPPA